MNVSLDIVRFCAIECRLQMSGELSVWWMIEAWLYAQEESKKGTTKLASGRLSTAPPAIDDVIKLGRLVEPNVNVHGFRRVDVRVGWDVKMNWENVPSSMANLMEALRMPPTSYSEGISVPVLTPDTFFKEYEEIHPFQDGNGRTGAILFNWLNGTLDDPVWPPNFWNDPRRTIGYGAGDRS